MYAPFKKLALWSLILVGVSLVTFLGVRIYDTQRGDPLEPWHEFVPHEMTSDALDHASFSAYLDAEKKIFGEIRHHVTEALPERDRVPFNRYFENSPVFPEHFQTDWNRSYVLEPEGTPLGAVVLLHGLTDSPYSLRHIARFYRDHGFVAVAIRLPAHGTVPAALTDVTWTDWLAATRLAVREADLRVGPSKPLHLVGFSNGGALALKYALDAIEDPKLRRPDRLVLLTPMIGITRFARFAGMAGWPALLPAFAKAAWLGIVPEFNPFKYNSFPVNGARQSFQFTQAIQRQIDRMASEGRLTDLAPVLTFQSIVDSTVSTRAIISSFYARLPANGSELVLFDINRNAKFGQLLSTASETALTRLLPPAPRPFRTVVISNVDPDSSEAAAVVTEAGATETQSIPLGLSFPQGVFSLSHVALPFPVTDALYGLQPDNSEDFGVHLGAIPPRGERGALIVSLDNLLRMSSNPFYPFMIDRIAKGLPAGSETRAKAAP
ncbi:alpha/beta hydrolase [Beijerinckia indica]|uniref:AB hydrolase-1 domain-containing protein n=1 Tax=Beijerinckia indica subsp. indica (strain ATCC 9039 / DSM 1715 / NCIMB 8712) TaxID=395963 RepID=B2IAX4_BEII9|nr:alpha/beta hydrolase [Beijerinckia indica]ACB93674.1 conserved hypothetical protein [Beijerinckia indica subsp. indica ATCC 9039]